MRPKTLAEAFGYSKQSKTRRIRNSKSLRRLIFEAEADLAKQVQAAGAKPITLVVLYGPPAAGKGAAKGAIGEFIGATDAGNFEDWLDDLGSETGSKHFQEEDAAMVNITTGILPVAVFKELLSRTQGGENFDEIVDEYFHVNEKGKKFELSSILSADTFEQLAAEGETGAQEFASFPNTAAFFTQARGFSKPIEGLDEKTNAMMGPSDGTSTLGIRAAAASKYLDDVKNELKGLMGGVEKVEETPYATVYLADQAGESTADVPRINALGKLKADPEFDALKIIGVYIHQPAARTRMANLHRAATGGRRVAQSEVDRIFKAGPTVDDGEITDKGDAIRAMEDNFDQVHLYYPKNPFDPEDIIIQGVPIGQRICEPLGPGKGHLDIEGCEDEAQGSATGARSLAGMEKYAVKSAQLPDDEVEAVGGGIPNEKDLEDEEKDKIVQAFEKMGFSGVTLGDLDSYLQAIDPPKIRKGGKHGRVPWSVEMFGDEYKKDSATVKGRSPDQRITIKDEGAYAQRSSDDIIVERWQKLAGLLKG